MGKATGIPFCTATHNFWIGCKKISAGCKFCYFYREYGGRFKKDPTKVKLPANNAFDEPLRWKKPQIIFINSWSDFYIKEADEWRERAFDVIRKTPQHFYIIITKRIDRTLKCLPADWGKGWPNVIHLVSAEKQKDLDYRVKKLLEIHGLRGIIAEPLLEPINLAPYLNIPLSPTETVKPIHWVIAGGESGNDQGEWKYRTCKLEWLHDIVKQCAAEQVPVFIKQLGTAIAKMRGMKSDRHGENINDPAYPMYLKNQEFPEKLPEIFWPMIGRESAPLLNNKAPKKV